MLNDVEAAKPLINEALMTFLSSRNSGYESYYHGFLLGIFSIVAPLLNVFVLEELETGKGYSDIVLSYTATSTAVIFEFKKTKETPKALKTGCEESLSQIKKNRYYQKFIDDGFSIIYGIGIAFGGKYCEIKSLGNLLEK